MVNTISQQGVKLASQLLGLHSTVGGEDPDPSTSVLICFPWSHSRCPGEGEVRQCPVDENALPNDLTPLLVVLLLAVVIMLLNFLTDPV